MTTATDGPDTRARLRARKLAEGGAIGVALWCMAATCMILPGPMAGIFGLIVTVAIAALARASRFSIWLGALFVFSAAVVVVTAVTPLSARISSAWMREDAVPDSGVGAVVVLSGGLTTDGFIGSDALDRLIGGLELTRTAHVPLLVTTLVTRGYRGAEMTNDADVGRIVRLAGGQLEWLRTPVVYTTRDEATETAALLGKRGVKRIAVVTSPLHTRRACATFERVGFQVVCVASAVRGWGGRTMGRTRDRLSALGQWIYEAAGVLKYKSRGWM